MVFDRHQKHLREVTTQCEFHLLLYVLCFSLVIVFLVALNAGKSTILCSEANQPLKRESQAPQAKIILPTKYYVLGAAPVIRF